MPIHASSNGWILETNHTAYAFGLNTAGLLTHRYWGARLPDVNDYPAPANPVERSSFDTSPHMTPEEYPGYGGLRYIDPCLKITFADGVRDVALAFESFSVTASDSPELAIRLKDVFYPVAVTLHYRPHEAYDLIERWVTLENLGGSPITIERVYSAKWTLPPGDPYFLTHMHGRHIDEYHLHREPLTPGLKVIESRRLTTSHHHAPWFAVDRNASEDAGEVWFGTLAWSGNWKITAEVTEFASTRLNIGLNDWDFAWKLVPGE